MTSSVINFGQANGTMAAEAFRGVVGQTQAAARPGGAWIPGDICRQKD